MLRLRLIPSTGRVRGPAEATVWPAETYRGAVPPAKYEVVRWPRGMVHYNGTVGRQARESYEYQHPLPGEAVELWELGTCRGHKEA